MKKFSKVLIANRGEIALRIIRAAHEMGIQTVAIYSAGEENALHVTSADEYYYLGNGDLSTTYLDIEKIVGIAKISNAEAIHPGYGFLSENPSFALACEKKGIAFIGPRADVLEKMGNKMVAKEIAINAGINVLSSSPFTIDKIEVFAKQQNYPLIIKAAYGGGGKGMQVVYKSEELIEKTIGASRAAENYFGNGEIYLEKFVPNARHIEVQLLGDKHGNLVHLFERDCTLQRNHQKIIEEAPATSISETLRNELHQAALRLGRIVGYENAGTVEFLVDEQQNFYFLEVNPRIQVEHPVTEQITGIDLVKEQLLIAAGNQLSFSQEGISCNGHSIEARIYAEDPLTGFTPSTVPVHAFNFPNNRFIRVESDCQIEANNTMNFDPLLAKVIATGKDREDAKGKIISALKETSIIGPVTNQRYLLSILEAEAFGSKQVSTQYCTTFQSRLIDTIKQKEQSYDRRFLIAGALYLLFLQKDSSGLIWKRIGFWRITQQIDLRIGKELLTVEFKMRNNVIEIRVGGNLYLASVLSGKNNHLTISIEGDKQLVHFYRHDNKLMVSFEGFTFDVSSPDLLSTYPVEDYKKETTTQQADNVVKSHLYGKIISIYVSEGQTVNTGDLLLVIESMKSENKILSPQNGKVQRIAVKEGDQVSDHEPLLYLEEF